MINLENVSKSYGEYTVVKNLSFTVSDGETLVLLGKSGCGKTTTLKMINRLIEPDSGTITVDNHDIYETDAIALRRKIGYVFQNIGLLPHYTIKDNLSVVANLLNWDKERIKKQLEQVCDTLKIDKYLLKRKPRELSGGQKQRIGVGRALMANPNIILMDEPFGALDPITRTEIQDEFSSLKHLINKTIVFVTHDIHEAFVLADRICIMEDGNIAQLGTKQDILYKPANEFVSAFVKRHFDALKAEVS